MVESRRTPRHRVLKAGTIEFGGGAIDCTVRNLSNTGAALEVSNQIGIPEKFALVVPGDGLHLPAMSCGARVAG
jgi:PilZ domain